MRSCAAAASVTLAAGGAAAHGAAPAALGLPEGAQDAAGVLRLSSGLALGASANGAPDQPRWRYLCAASWGGQGAPSAVADDERVWVLGPHSARAWSGEWVDEVPLELGAVRDLVGARGTAWALTHEDGQPGLRALGDAAFVPLDAPWSSVEATSSGFVLARVEDDTLRVSWIDGGGAQVSSGVFDLGAEGASASLRVAGGRLFASIRQRAGYRLLELPAPARDRRGPPLDVRSYDPIGGPVAWEGRLLALRDGAIVALDDADLQGWGDRRFTCLSEVGGLAIVCSVDGIQALPDGPEGELEELFSWPDLAPPRAEDVPPEDWPECWAEWVEITNHHAIEADAELAADSSAEREDRACAAAPARAPARPAPWYGLALALLGMTSRSRRSGARPARLHERAA